MKKLNKDYIARVKADEDLKKKRNYTFSLTKKIMDDFRIKCGRQDVSMASVLEMMIKDFLDN